MGLPPSAREGPDNMIEEGDEQLNEDNRDYEKLEAVGTMMAKRAMSSKESERKKRDLITIGKAKGFLTYDEVNDHMPEGIGSSDQIDRAGNDAFCEFKLS